MITTLATCPAVAAGDVRGALTNVEMDRILHGTIALPSATFWRWQQEDGQGEWTERIRQTVAERSTRRVLLVVWVRHHWVLWVLDGGASEVWDSAKSSAVARDLTKWALQLGVPTPSFVTCPQQIRGSSECGLFTIMFAECAQQGLTGLGGGTCSLQALREAYPNKAEMIRLGYALFGITATEQHQYGARKEQREEQVQAGTNRNDDEIRAILRTASPGARIEVEWRFDSEDRPYAWRGGVWERASSNGQVYWETQFLIEDKDGARARASSRLPQPPMYKNRPIVVAGHEDEEGANGGMAPPE